MIKKCPECGSEKMRWNSSKVSLHCNECGLQYDADANGSWNILGRGVRCRDIFPKILNKWVECALGAVP